MFKKGTYNGVFTIKNKMDTLRIRKNRYLFTGLSHIESSSNVKRVCFRGLGMSRFGRSNFKSSCSLSGKYGSSVGQLPVSRFILLKKMLFSEMSFTSKKSW